LAERPGFAEAVHEAEEMPVTLLRKFAQPREIERGGIGQIEPDLIMAVLEHVEEDRAPPMLGSLAVVITGRAIFECVPFIGRRMIPLEAPALEDGMQRVDDDEGTRQVDTGGAAARTEAAQQVVFGKAGKALADQPVDQVEAKRKVHTPLCRA